MDNFLNFPHPMDERNFQDGQQSTQDVPGFQHDDAAFDRDQEYTFPSFKISRRVLGLGLVVVLLATASLMGDSGSLTSLLVRHHSHPQPEPIFSHSNLTSMLSHLKLSSKLPEVLSAEQLQELEDAIIRFIDEHTRKDATEYKIIHEELVLKQVELNDLRGTYQSLSRQLLSIKERYKNDVERRDQELQAERERNVAEMVAKNNELKRIRTGHADIVNFMESRKKSEEFLNETVRGEVHRIFEEIASAKPVMERAKAARLWLLNTFVLAGELNSEMRLWNRNLRRELEKIVLDGVTSQRAKQIAVDAYEKYLADQTGMFDFALKTTGATVVSIRKTVPAEVPESEFVSGDSTETTRKLSAELIITPGYLPGQCWPFVGLPGVVVIKLAVETFITHFAMDYMPKRLSPTGKLLPAPRVFEVYGLDSVSDDNSFHFGTYEYDTESDQNVHIYSVQNRPPNDRAYQFVELKIISNHGSPFYTSICRFRVHGNVTEDPEECGVNAKRK